MNNSKISLNTLRKLADYSQKNNDIGLCEILNSFDGDSTYEKFINILTIWSEDVDDSLALTSNGRTLNVQLEYLLSEFPEKLIYCDEVRVEKFKVFLNIPKKFVPVEDLFPIYEIIDKLQLHDISLNILDLSSYDKVSVISQLPPQTYNIILNNIFSDEDKVIKFSNPALTDLKLNVFTYDMYLFLKRLVANYSKEYFLDIIYHLSKRIDGDILLDSTPTDIRYFTEKLNVEVKNQQRD